MGMAVSIDKRINDKYLLLFKTDFQYKISLFSNFQNPPDITKILIKYFEFFSKSDEHK